MSSETKRTKHVLIVGGGTAGWLTAGILAAEHRAEAPDGLKVTLIESPDVATIGVGEGTWPTMRDTLRSIGISESDFIRDCDASFKQGSYFKGWMTDAGDDAYDHPFVLPQGYGKANMAAFWQARRERASFADMLSFQPHLCAHGRAPKQRTTPEYAAVANYGYHLDAGKFAMLLMRHCTEKLGVRHMLDHVTGVRAAENGDIAALETKGNGNLEADLFIDCTGMGGQLIGGHYGVPFIDRRDVLFNDSALAVQLPYASDDAPIASRTVSTAREAGWIWDIGLQSRRGVGYVYSSAHTDDEAAAEMLSAYVGQDVSPRKLSFQPGFRAEFWHRNCVAIGMASGFIEPLEASALVMVELAAGMLARDLPADRAAMDIVAKRYNRRFRYRWDRIIDFLKLHYVLSRRSGSAYWRDNRDPATVPERLQELLSLWAVQPPSASDLYEVEEVFPSASYQYVLYGMGFETQARATRSQFDDMSAAERHAAEAAMLTQKFLGGLPSNRDLINHIRAHGLPRP